MASQIVTSLTQNAGITLGALSVLLGLTAVTIIAVMAIISTQWRKVRVLEDNNALKQAMLEKGMSAAEIATAIKASPKSSSVQFDFTTAEAPAPRDVGRIAP